VEAIAQNRFGKLKSMLRKRVYSVSCSPCPSRGQLLSLNATQKNEAITNKKINYLLGTSQRVLIQKKKKNMLLCHRI